MTVRDLIDTNQKITDVQITVRKDGTRLLDQLNIGCHEGIKPRFPTRVPKDEKYINNFSTLDSKMYKDAAYIPKSINAWDDGHDYWQVKTNRIPDKWLALEVFGWDAAPALTHTHLSPRRSTDGHTNVNFHGLRISITALPSGEKLDIPEPIQKQPKEELDGQMSFDDWNIEVVTL